MTKDHLKRKAILLNTIASRFVFLVLQHEAKLVQLFLAKALELPR